MPSTEGFAFIPWCFRGVQRGHHCGADQEGRQYPRVDYLGWHGQRWEAEGVQPEARRTGSKVRDGNGLQRAQESWGRVVPCSASIVIIKIIGTKLFFFLPQVSQCKVVASVSQMPSILSYFPCSVQLCSEFLCRDIWDSVKLGSLVRRAAWYNTSWSS